MSGLSSELLYVDDYLVLMVTTMEHQAFLTNDRKLMQKQNGW